VAQTLGRALPLPWSSTAACLAEVRVDKLEDALEVEVALVRLEDAAEVEVIELDVMPPGSRSHGRAVSPGLRTSATCRAWPSSGSRRCPSTHRSARGDEVLAQEQQGAPWRKDALRTR
jgi:hypothetical protein